MMRRAWLSLFLLLAFGTIPVQADSRFIVRVNGGSSAIQTVCSLAGCTVVETIDGSIGQLFLVTLPDFLPPDVALQILSGIIGVVNVEPDLIAHIADTSPQVPLALEDNKPAAYYGATVIHGYVYQPATQMVNLAKMHKAFPNATGAGVVAVIDTGVDPAHPVLENVLIPGYDFTRNRSGADETLDVKSSLAGPPIVKGVGPQWVQGNGSGDLDQSTAAVVDQSTAAVVDGNPQYSDFGHGTMVAGIIHLVAPKTKILPLKAFRADGTAFTSDILRATYCAIGVCPGILRGVHANVFNMSFHLASYSKEMARVLQLASLTGVISVAAVGNDGENTSVYPAALSVVMGVASVANNEQLSSFSNYGPMVWVAAPGEGVVTTYPFSTYAASWGTSFSTPFVSGAAAAILSLNPFTNQNAGARAIANADPIGPNTGHGELDLYQAIKSVGKR